MIDEDIDSINKHLKETLNRIPKKFKKNECLNYIFKQSFQQLAAIKIFNNDNIIFSNEIIPNKVMDDYILFNTFSKKKAELENIQQTFSDDIISKDTFEEVYEKMDNMYDTKNNFMQYESLNPFEGSQTQNIQKFRKLLLKKFLQKKPDHKPESIHQNQQNIRIQKDENIDQLDIEPDTELIDQPETIQENENKSIQEIQPEEDIVQQDIEPNKELINQSNNQQDNEIVQENENKNYQEIQPEKDIVQQDIEPDTELIDQPETIQENENENYQEIQPEKDIVQQDIEPDTELIDQPETIQENENENYQEIQPEEDIAQPDIEPNKELIDQSNNQQDNEIVQKNEDQKDVKHKIASSLEYINQGQQEIVLNLPQTNQQKIKSNFKVEDQDQQENEIIQKIEPTLKDENQYQNKHNQEIKLFQNISEISIEPDRPKFIFKVSDNKQIEKEINDKVINSVSQVKEDEIQINTDSNFLDKYQFIIQNLNQYFNLLYRIGYGHFALLSKELKIENYKEEISFYSSTAAVIILFRLLHEEDDYTRFQNLILTLSNLFARFNINMIRKNEKDDGNAFKIKENKKFQKYNFFMKNSVEEAINKLGPFYIEYLKTINVEDFMNVLEVRCAFDNWLLSNKNAKRVEIPFEFLIPSKFSQFDLQISSCLIEHKNFSEEMKPRINDFAYLFTYLNIIDGLDKRIIINEWTKPEIEKIKTTLLNFGSSSVSTLQFIAKTSIITKSFRSIINFADKIVKSLNNESKNQLLVDGFDDEILQRIKFNTNVYDSSKSALSMEKDNGFNSKETEFIKLLLNNGVEYFDDIFLDKKYNFKDMKFTNFDEFLSRVANKIE